MEQGIWRRLGRVVYGLSDPGDVYVILFKSVLNKDDERESSYL
jgi:hypothetical protein